MLKKIALPSALVILLVNLCFLGWYLFVGYRELIHSDSAVKVLIAREIFEVGDYFPDDWNYVNGDLMVLFGHTFILPVLAILPAGFKAHALSGVASSVLILLGVWLLTELAKISAVHRFMIVASVAAGISGFAAENLFGQVSYGTVLYFTCFSVYFSWRSLNARGRERSIWGMALLLLMALAFWANPQRALVSYVLPLGVAAAFLSVGRNNFTQVFDKKSILTVLGFAGLGALCGEFLHIHTISGSHNILGAGHARWLSYELMVRNSSLFLKGYLAIFGGLPSTDQLVVSMFGLYEAIRMLAAMVLLVLMPIAVVRVMRHGKPAMVFLLVFALTVFLTVLFIQLTTSVPDMRDPVQSSRYLVVALILLLLVVLTQSLDFENAFFFSAAQAVLFVVMLTSAYPAFKIYGISSEIHWGISGQRNSASARQDLIEYLVRNNLEYGYASYWNAGVLSVLSDERVLVRQIDVDNGLPRPMRHLSSNRWYRPSAWSGMTFLLLTPQEEKLLDLARMEVLGLVPSQIKEFGGYKIMVFPENVASKLPGWDSRYESPTKFSVSKSSLSQVGRFYSDYVGAGPALVAEKGQVGALHFGPYVDVEPGRYRAIFDVVADHQSSAPVRLDISAASDQKIFGVATLTESHQPQTIDFSLDKARTMEFRVWSLGSGKVIFKGVTIQRLQEVKS